MGSQALIDELAKDCVYAIEASTDYRLGNDQEFEVHIPAASGLREAIRVIVMVV